MRSRKPRLLAEYDTQMEADRYDDSVDGQVTRVESNRPTCQYENDRNVHRIARDTVKAHNNELLRRSPGRESATTGHIEVPDCPKQQGDLLFSDTAIASVLRTYSEYTVKNRQPFGLTKFIRVLKYFFI